MKCSKCKQPAEKLYRDRPKGERAKFVCVFCLPDEMKPKRALTTTVEDLINALR
jgi:hypothetical protein